jgi:DNA-binding XRE family transcriptional regulator
MANGELKITIKAARVNCGLTQREAAEAIGCSRESLQAYECGKTIPNWAIVKRIEEVYGIPIDNLIFAGNLT